MSPAEHLMDLLAQLLDALEVVGLESAEFELADAGHRVVARVPRDEPAHQVSHLLGRAPLAAALVAQLGQRAPWPTRTTAWKAGYSLAAVKSCRRMTSRTSARLRVPWSAAMR